MSQTPPPANRHSAGGRGRTSAAPPAPAVAAPAVAAAPPLPTPAPPVPVQSQLFPRKVLRLDPPVPGRGVDNLGEAEADDSFRYVLKGDKDGRPVRANEWICTKLAELIGFAAPSVIVMEMSDGTQQFGSRRLGGLADEVNTASYLLGNMPPGFFAPVVPMRTWISSLYAFDMAVQNEDRHLNNYLFVNDRNASRPVAFDFGRSLLWQWPWLDFIDPRHHTRTQGAMLRRLHGFDLTAAEQVVDRLKATDASAIARFIGEMPSDWLVDPLRSEFLQWWTGPQRITRLDTLSKGLSDGTLL